MVPTRSGRTMGGGAIGLARAGDAASDEPVAFVEPDACSGGRRAQSGALASLGRIGRGAAVVAAALLVVVVDALGCCERSWGNAVSKGTAMAVRCRMHRASAQRNVDDGVVGRHSRPLLTLCGVTVPLTVNCKFDKEISIRVSYACPDL